MCLRLSPIRFLFLILFLGSGQMLLAYYTTVQLTDLKLSLISSCCWSLGVLE